MGPLQKSASGLSVGQPPEALFYNGYFEISTCLTVVKIKSFYVLV
jgi:hypothetical protein